MAAVVVLASAVAGIGVAAAEPESTERVSLTDTDGETDNFSTMPAISGDGRFVAFQSVADNVVGGDTNTAHDVFVRDRMSGTTERVSVATGGGEASANSGFVFGSLGSIRIAISDDGRFVAFASQAADLVAGDTNDEIDIFLHDRQTGVTERISITDDEREANGAGATPSLSADGRFVSFTSNASNLVAGDTNGTTDVFVRDRQNETTERVSIADDEIEAMGASLMSAISSDGRFIAFQSEAANLVANDTNGTTDIFVRDRTSGTTERMSISTDDTQADDHCDGVDISANGTKVVFSCLDATLVAGDGNGVRDVFVRDRQSRTTERVSVLTGGGEANGASGDSTSLSISGDGRRVAFASVASNLVDGDTNGVADVFLRDLKFGTTERVSLADDGTQADDWSAFSYSVSANGAAVAFASNAGNLVPMDANGAVDVFVRTVAADFRYEYAAKLVCGVQASTDDMRLARGFYATTINVHNPNDEDVRFFKKLALTIPPGEQRPGRIYPIAKDRLAYDEALAVDCADIGKRVFEGDLPARYIEGFVVIDSTHALDVTGVYTTAALDEHGRVTLHSSIDVEHVAERDRGEATDLSIRKSIAALDSNTFDRHTAAFIVYRIEVTNYGSADAEDITVTDHLESELPTLGVNEGSFEATHNGMWTLVDATNTTADIEVSIADLPAGETAILEFHASVVFDSADPVNVTDTATVESETTDSNPGNNSAQVVTVLGQ